MGWLDNVFAKKVEPPVTPKPKLTVRGSSNLGAGTFQNRHQQNVSLWNIYRNNPMAYRAIKSITGAISKGYELVAFDKNQDVISIPELEAFLNHPNATDSFEELVGNICTQMLVFGACYLEIQRQSLTEQEVRPVIAKLLDKALNGAMQIVPELVLEEEDLVSAAVINGIPTAMQVLPSQQIEVQMDKMGVITGYKQTIDAKTIVMFAPHEILLMLYPGSMDKAYGDSPLEPISNTIVNDTLIRRAQQEKLLNVLGLATIISLPDGTSQDEVDRVHEQLMQNYRGANSKGRFLVTSTEVKVTDMDHSNDGDYLKLRELHKEEIAMTMGIPMSVLGESDGNGLNGGGQTGQYRTFIENTCRPLARHIQADLNAQIVAPWVQLGATNVMLRLVLEDTTDTQQLETLWATGISNGTYTINEVRALRGGMDPLDGGDEAYIAAKDIFPVKNIGSVAVPVAPPVPTNVEPIPDQAQKAITDARRALSKLRKHL